MSTKKKPAKVLKSVPQNDKRTALAGSLSSPNLSFIEKVSFLESQSYGNPLHSTALEENLIPAEGQRGEAGGRQCRGQSPKEGTSDTPKRPAKAQAQIKDRDGQPTSSKLSVPLRRSLGAKDKARPVKERLQEVLEEDPVTASPSVSQSLAAVTDLPNSPSPAQKRRRPSLSSEELSEDDEPSWKDDKGQKMAKTRKSWRSPEDQRRKSSSESSDSEGAASRPNQLQGRVKNPSHLDVVLASFQEFTSLYRETVESKVVRQAIDAFTSSMQDQLSEKITEARELVHLKKENMKVANAINSQRRRLLEAKNEAIGRTIEVREQQRERATLQQRLKDLRRSSALLSGLEHLHSSYLQNGNSDQPHEYGVSSLPALIVEAQGSVGSEEQLRTVITRLEKAMDMPT